jgi:hypothetical protein
MACPDMNNAVFFLQFGSMIINAVMLHYVYFDWLVGLEKQGITSSLKYGS